MDPARAGAGESIKRHATQITTVALSGLHLEDDGHLDDRMDRHLLRLAQNQGLRAMAVVQNLDARDGSWRPDRVQALARNRRSRQRLADELVRICAAEHLQGIHLDLERLDDWRVLAPIASDLQRVLRREQLELQIDVPPGIDAPLASLARTASGIVVMAYDEYDAASPAGPVASPEFVESALTSAVAHMPAARLTAALAVHGYEWVSGERGRRVSFDEAQLIAQRSGSRLRRNGDQLHAQFEEAGKSHEIWLADAHSVRSQLRIAAAAQVTSMALWQIGEEDPEIWAALVERRQPPRADRPPELRADAEGASRLDLRGAVHSPRPDNPELGDRSYDRSRGSERPITNDLLVDLSERGPAASGALRRVAGRRSQARDRALPDERGLLLTAPFSDNVQSTVIKRDTAALLFEGGVDPRSTPLVLEVLAQQHVPATFFVSGMETLREPSLVERLFREGHAIGNRGMAHANTDTPGDLRVRMELETTSRLIEILIGRRPRLFRRAPETRAPRVGDVTESDRNLIAELGYLDPTQGLVTSERDGTEETVRQALADADRTGIIVLGAAPGRRADTIRALPLIIARLRATGFRVVPLASVLGKQRDDVMPRAPARLHPGERVTTFLLASALAVSRLFPAILWLSLGLFATRVVVMTTLAVVCSRRTRLRLTPAPFPSVTALIPVLNRKLTIDRTIDALLTSDIPLDVVVVDDGSTDGTAERLAQRYRREPRVRLLRQAGAGTTAALLSGFAVCKTDVVITIHDDARVAPDTARRLVEPLRDASIGAVSGTLQVDNIEHALGRWQALEALVHYEIGQRAWTVLGIHSTVPVTMGAWRRRAVVEAGGFSAATLAPDFDLTMTLRGRGWRVVHADRARAHVTAPSALRTFVGQRIHSSFGILQVLWRHRPWVAEGSRGQLSRSSWLASFVAEVLLPLSVVPACGTATIAALAGNAQPALLAAVVLFALELAQLGVASLLSAQSGGQSTGRLLRSLVASQLVYRPLRLAIALRSIGRLVDGAPIGSKWAARNAAMAYIAAMRANARR